MLFLCVHEIKSFSALYNTQSVIKKQMTSHPARCNYRKTFTWNPRASDDSSKPLMEQMCDIKERRSVAARLRETSRARSRVFEDYPELVRVFTRNITSPIRVLPRINPRQRSSGGMSTRVYEKHQEPASEAKGRRIPIFQNSIL